MVDAKFDLKLILEFDRFVLGILVVEWMKNLKYVCRWCRVKSLEHVIPLNLTGEVFAVYQQLDDEAKANGIQVNIA